MTILEVLVSGVVLTTLAGRLAKNSKFSYKSLTTSSTVETINRKTWGELFVKEKPIQYHQPAKYLTEEMKLDLNTEEDVRYQKAIQAASSSDTVIEKQKPVLNARLEELQSKATPAVKMKRVWRRILAQKLPVLFGVENRPIIGFDKLTHYEAARILNVETAGLTAKKIRDGHKKIMLLNHPDNGGSTFIATKINEAKEYLLQYVEAGGTFEQSGEQTEGQESHESETVSEEEKEKEKEEVLEEEDLGRGSSFGGPGKIGKGTRGNKMKRSKRNTPTPRRPDTTRGSPEAPPRNATGTGTNRANTGDAAKPSFWSYVKNREQMAEKAKKNQQFTPRDQNE